MNYSRDWRTFFFFFYSIWSQFLRLHIRLDKEIKEKLWTLENDKIDQEKPNLS